MIKVLPEETKFKCDSKFIKNITLTSFFLKHCLSYMQYLEISYLSTSQQRKRNRPNGDARDILTPFN